MTLYHYENILGMELALYCKTVFFKRFTNRSNFQLLHDIESAKPCTTDRNKSIVSVTDVIFQRLDLFRNIVVLQNHFMAFFITLHHCFTRFLLLLRHFAQPVHTKYRTWYWNEEYWFGRRCQNIAHRFPTFQALTNIFSSLPVKYLNEKILY